MRLGTFARVVVAAALAGLLSSGSCVVAFRSGCGVCDCDPRCDCDAGCEAHCECDCGFCAGATFGLDSASGVAEPAVPVLLLERGAGPTNTTRIRPGRWIPAGEGREPRLLLGPPLEAPTRR